MDSREVGLVHQTCNDIVTSGRHFRALYVLPYVLFVFSNRSGVPSDASALLALFLRHSLQRVHPDLKRG